MSKQSCPWKALLSLIFLVTWIIWIDRQVHVNAGLASSLVSYLKQQLYVPLVLNAHPSSLRQTATPSRTITHTPVLTSMPTRTPTGTPTPTASHTPT